MGLAFLAGFVLQTAYLAFELSDGEFFDASAWLPRTRAKWGE